MLSLGDPKAHVIFHKEVRMGGVDPSGGFYPACLVLGLGTAWVGRS